MNVPSDRPAPGAAGSGTDDGASEAWAMGGGFAIWLTGLVGAGKSTIARGLAAALRERGYRVEVLDGEEVRQELSRGLGFSKEDRDLNVGRLAFVANLLARNGVVAIIAAVSPYREAREAARRRIGRFAEVYVRCPLDELVRRDVRGLYDRALRGEVPVFTGVSDPYEEPISPEVVVRTDRESIAESVALIVGRLEELGYLPAPDSAESAILARLQALGYIEPDDWPTVPAEGPSQGPPSSSPPREPAPAARPAVAERPGSVESLAVIARLLRRFGRGPRGTPRRLVAADQERDQELVERVAEALFRRSFGDGGWAIDVGGLGPRAFAPEAVEALNSIALGRAEPGPPLP